MAKPVVDGLERNLSGQADVVRVNIMSQVGLVLTRRYRVRAMPTLLVFDGAGNIVHAQVGVPSPAAVLTVVASLTAE